MLRLGSILAEEKIEEVVEIIFFRKHAFTKYYGFYVALLQFFIREQMTNLGPHWEVGGGGGGWLHLIYQCGKGIVKISLL